MTDPGRLSLDITWRTFARIVVTALLVWIRLRLSWLALVILIALVLAVTLEPVVRWLADRRWPRWLASTSVMLVLTLAIVGFVFITSNQLAEQARLLGGRMDAIFDEALTTLPHTWVERLVPQDAAQSFEAYVRQTALVLFRSTAQAVAFLALAAIITLYLLIEGSVTYAWLIAFVPQGSRRKVARTIDECERVVAGYVTGNLLTSLFATVVVFTALSLLHVPAALLLALLAGVFDFVPVVGFGLSMFPALMLALTVSTHVALVVAVLYLVYHALENWVIGPWVYGDRLRLSNLVVVLAFAVGAELAGVVGALLALPIAAAYPAIEQIWLREPLGDRVVDEHAEIQANGEGA
ncbi:MAG: AI-2E family transporter [Vicinamibacterales bacterium]